MNEEFKLSNKTKSILDNFFKINPAILFHPGNVIRTKSRDQDVFAIAKIDEKIPIKFGIADLSKFLGIVGLYEDPDLQISDTTVTIKGKNHRKFTYTLSAETQLRKTQVVADDKDIAFENPLATFELDAAELVQLKKNLNAAGLTEVIIESNPSGKIVIKGTKTNDPTSDVYSSVLGKSNKNFNLIFVDRKILNMMDCNYIVDIAENIVRFKADNLEYYVAPELGSTYK